MAKKKVYNLMQTRYIINAKLPQFRAILEEAYKNGDELDFDDCRLGPYCASALKSYYGKVAMCNTEDPALDALLKRNAQTSTLQEEVYPTLQIPASPTIEDVRSMIATLPKGDRYMLNPVLGNNKQIAFCTLLIMSRPDIDWDISKCSVFIYEFVVDEWRKREEPHNLYIEFINSTVITLQKDGKGRIGSVSSGYLPVETYGVEHYILPADFGTEMLVNIDTSGKPHGEWADVVMKCLKVIVGEKKSVKHLADFLQFREEG